ncbi:FAD-linked oxidoreductase [Fontimonas thermophila]|uniref:FAD-linked oxidoreductase n=1 Tax=Fontimonas thermophila TaxID=1076937 RepID=A0A1I2J503_9GAMM|nr:D-arabinono-1,4-lactone oxidase [Fontimonas thermophila]SFF47811.1 FAD-linked oxidoreductase [Fontimonas thermophila]
MILSRRRSRGWTNWSGTVRCEPSHCAHPVTVEQIQAEVLRTAEEGQRLRVIGSGHSFSPLCWTDENHLALDRFTGIESTDFERKRVWVRAGTRLGRLVEHLADRGLALATVPSHRGITLGGALATGTHGSGAHLGNLAAQVTGLRLICADGAVRTVSSDQDPDLFHAAAVSLGALGVITHAELQCVDDHRLAVTCEAMTLAEMLERLDQLQRDHRHCEFLWFVHTDTVVLRRFDVTDALPTLLAPVKHVLRRGAHALMFRGMAETTRRLPALTGAFDRLTARMIHGCTDVLHARDVDSDLWCGRFQQLEYALPATDLAPVLRALAMLIKALGIRVHFPLQVRFVAADAHWLSPHYARNSACVAVPAYPDMRFDDYFAPIAELFERHDGRPHWGMIHELSAEQLRSLYPRFDDFRALRRRCDPRGVFLNPYLATLFDERLR